MACYVLLLFLKQHIEFILAWEPKDHQIREVPIPSETLQLLVNLQLETEEASPYVFISKARLLHILNRRSYPSLTQLATNDSASLGPIFFALIHFSL